jgi:hypothetical protein
MAFKMKGNPYKLGKMATKSTMKMAKKAAMKMKSMDDKTPMDLKKDPMMMKKDPMMMKKEDSAMKMKKGEPMKQAKPDYPDIDGDGNTKESMRDAAADKKKASGKVSKKASGKASDKKGAMTMKKSAAMKQTERQKSNLPKKLVEAIAKKAGKTISKAVGKEKTPKGAMTMKKSAIKQLDLEGLTTKKMDRLKKKEGKIKSKVIKASEEGKNKKVNRLEKRGKKIAAKYEKAKDKAIKKGKIRKNQKFVYDYDPANDPNNPAGK